MLQKIKAIKKNLRKVKIIDNKYFSDKSLPDYYSVSIVIATLDRPDDLKECLSSLFNQTFCRKVEIIVVDNNPMSGLTSSVVKEFPEIKLIQETRQGLSYARNKGIIEAKSEIIISLDDDVIISAGWLESLIAPFIDDDVAAVTGNIHPFELVTKPQKFFEEYGGLGRGEQNFIVNKEWFDNFIFRAVPTWEIGATANAAFRSSIFKNPKIGLLEEVLGPGMPSGVGEDTYLFYKILKEAKSIVYLSSAYVMHKHRREIKDLHKQIFNYSKGHIAYNLVTLFKEYDYRALIRLFIELPIWRIFQIISWFKNWKSYPLSLILLEITGNFLGPFALWQSYSRVNSEGRSK